MIIVGIFATIAIFYAISAINEQERAKKSIKNAQEQKRREEIDFCRRQYQSALQDYRGSLTLPIILVKRMEQSGLTAEETGADPKTIADWKKARESSSRFMKQLQLP